MEAVVHGHEPRRHHGPAHATAVGVERQSWMDRREGAQGAWRQLEQGRGGPTGDDERGQMEREQGNPPVVVRSDVG